MRKYRVFDNRNEKLTLFKGNLNDCVDYVDSHYKGEKELKYIEVRVIR